MIYSGGIAAVGGDVQGCGAVAVGLAEGCGAAGGGCAGQEDMEGARGCGIKCQWNEHARVDGRGVVVFRRCIHVQNVTCGGR